jgi:hypothetical protein
MQEKLSIPNLYGSLLKVESLDKESEVLAEKVE